MAINEAKKAYRKTPAEKEKRRLYAIAYRQRAEAKAREKHRAAIRRAAPGGAEANRERVKANRSNLGRNYISELVAESTGVACRDVPDEVVNMKREALRLRRMAATLTKAATDERDRNETECNNT